MSPYLERAAFVAGALTRQLLDIVAWPLRRAMRAVRVERPRVVHERCSRVRAVTSSRRGLSRPATPSSRNVGGVSLELEQAIADASPEARRLALETIVDLDAERATPLIGQLLNDPDATVRAAAALAAGRARCTGTVFSLLLALEDPIDEVRRAAAGALEWLTGARLDLDGPARRQQIATLERDWKERRLAELAEKDGRR